MIESFFRDKNGKILICIDSEVTAGRFVPLDDAEENRELIIDAAYQSMAAIFLILNLYSIPFEQFLEDPKLDEETKKLMERRDK
jgi:hypothetical protein